MGAEIKRGGARPNAGRKPGAANKATAKAREMAEATGIMPLEFMLSVMRDAKHEMSERLDMAKAAAPYVHAKLSSIDVRADIDAKAEIRVVEWLVVDPETPSA